MSRVYARGDALYLDFIDAGGKRARVASGYKSGEAERATAVLMEVEQKVKAMKGDRSFHSETISDAKRLVRGNQWLAVRTLLRRRDRIHNGRWKIVTLSGGAPAEEIQCIRHLMPKATIIAVDTDAACCEAAIDAGADDVLCCDVLSWTRQQLDDCSEGPLQPPAPIGDADAINLDFCGGITPDMGDGVRRFSTTVKPEVLMVTFSYGRDVTEVYSPGVYRGIPEPLSGRVAFLDARISKKMDLSSVIAYRGNEMPMCALMWSRFPHYRNSATTPRGNPSFAKVGDEALAVAVAQPDITSLYGLPAERVAAFQRQIIALRASGTRRATREQDEDNPASRLEASVRWARKHLGDEKLRRILLDHLRSVS